MSPSKPYVNADFDEAIKYIGRITNYSGKCAWKVETNNPSVYGKNSCSLSFEAIVLQRSLLKIENPKAIAINHL